MLEIVASPQEVNEILRLPRPSPAQTNPAPVVSYSLPWPDVSLIAFLRQAANAPRLYWESDKVAMGFAGCGVAAKLTAAGPGRFQTIRRAADRLFERIIVLNNDVPAAIGPRLFGGFSFRTGHQPRDLWAAFPPACFILPHYQLARFEGQTWLTINHRLGPEDDPMGIERILRDEARRLAGSQFPAPRQPQSPKYEAQRWCEQPKSDLPGRQQVISNNVVAPSTLKLNGTDSPLHVTDLITPDTWHNLITAATQRIRHNELDKVVFARARQISSAGPIEVTDVLDQLQQNYPDCYRFLFEPVPGHAFYGATPELLAEVSGSSLHTVALAGSIRRGRSLEEDEALGRELLANPKEQIEHAHVVEAIEENLKPLISKLKIAPEPDLCRLSNIQHIQTIIEAELTAGCDALTVVEALHPTPALGGRPRRLALPMINQLEPTARGWYGAPIGWLDGRGNGRFAVAIRSAVSVGAESMLFAGAGIVADSQPDKEWRETELKFKPLMDALRRANSQ